MAESMSASDRRRTPEGRSGYDLEQRTARFGEDAIDFARTVPMNPITRSLVGQLVRSATSIGANYCEADDAFTKKEFRHRIGICKKEARETKHWLRMIVRAEPAAKPRARRLWQEAKELHLIFTAILRSSRSREQGSDSEVSH